MNKNETIFSIICPTLNEESFIEKIIVGFIENCPQPSELYIVDAGSSDKTREIVEHWIDRFPGIYLLENPRRYVSYAFNLCYSRASGRYLALLGAHALYPPEFYKAALKELEANTCDVVGGPLKQLGKGNWGNAIAHCMSVRFGVGDSKFRVSKARAYVDTVAFAFYKRELFEMVGLFDTDLKRNQDDELHYRIHTKGYRILMLPEMECAYYVRDSPVKLWNQYFEYGFFKPLVLAKVNSGLRLRHLAPAIFCIYLFFTPVFLIYHFNIFWIPLVTYLFLTLSWSIVGQLTLADKMKCLLIFPILHLSYGFGFLRGLSLAIRNGA